MFTNICHFKHIWIQACFFHTSTECFFMHTRRTGSYNYTIQIVLFYCILNQFLSRFRTHIFVVCAESNTRIISYIFCNLCTIDNRADIRATVTNKYPNSFHYASPPSLVFPIFVRTASDGIKCRLIPKSLFAMPKATPTNSVIKNTGIFVVPFALFNCT